MINFGVTLKILEKNVEKFYRNMNVKDILGEFLFNFRKI